MSDGSLRTLTLVTSLGCGLTAGVFFAFSTFVMKGLDDLPPAQGIRAMQSINRAAPSAGFMLALLGTAVACVALIVVAVRHWHEPGSGYRLGGGLSYLAAVLLTVGYHVPRNEKLDRLDPTSAGAAADWSSYVSDWTSWNHVRAAAALAGAAALAMALRSE